MAPPYFVAAGLGVLGEKIDDPVRMFVQVVTFIAHLALWIFVFGTEYHDLDNDNSVYKDGSSVNQLQSLSFTAFTVAFATIVVAYIVHLLAKPGYSDGEFVLPPGATALINGLLSASILTNTLLFIYIFVDVDRMLHFNEKGPGAPYTGPTFTHDNKQDMAMTIVYKIFIMAILKTNQSYQETHAKREATKDALLGGK
jgi:hypothetical protein